MAADIYNVKKFSSSESLNQYINTWSIVM